MLTPLECALLQLEDYRKENNISDWTTLVTDNYDTQFFIYKTENDEVVICFCPSNSKVDWKNNFYFFLKPYKNMNEKFYVHSGFLRCWKEVRDYIEEEVKRLNPKSITVTGWSYGGALSILCKEDMEYLFKDIDIQCVTFGAPRVISRFNWKKISSRWKNTKQFKNGADVVTAVPLMSMFFRHAGELIHIGKPIRFWRYFNPWNYHQIKNYIKTLEKISTDK